MKAYWKRFAALVTAYADKYRFDPFVRTEFNIIVLQVGFVLVILALVGIGFNFLYQDISSTLVENIMVNVETGAMVEDPATFADKVGLKSNLISIAFVIILFTAVFGYFVARFTLAPTRNALSVQKQFIGNIAHEIRTPIAILKTNTEVSLLDPSLSPKVQNVLQSNIEELDRVSNIINNLLSFNSLIRPERLEYQNVDLGDVVEAAVRQLSHVTRKKDIAITVRKGTFRIVWGNSAGVEQIVMNLLKNAINFTSDGGRITVTVEPDYHGSISLVVEDTGIGISRKDLFRIFEPFYRAERSRTRKFGGGGSGLGLTIVSEIIKLHKGHITIRSALQQGTTVTVLLPCGKEKTEKPGSSKDLNEIAVDFSKRQS